MAVVAVAVVDTEAVEGGVGREATDKGVSSDRLFCERESAPDETFCASPRLPAV